MSFDRVKNVLQNNVKQSRNQTIFHFEIMAQSKAYKNGKNFLLNLTYSRCAMHNKLCTMFGSCVVSITVKRVRIKQSCTGIVHELSIINNVIRRRYWHVNVHICLLCVK